MANFENDKSPKNVANVEEPLDSTVDIPIEEDDELDLSIFDDDDEQDTGEPDIEADADEPEPIVQETKPKQLSKEERKIQALKAEAKRLQAEKTELQKKLEAKFDTDATDELHKKYIAAGYDEDEARTRAKTEVKQTRLEEDLELLKFQLANQTLLSKYPKAQAEISKVLRVVKVSGMTAEQVLRGMYGNSTPAYEQRAKDAAMGKFDNTVTDNTVAGATRTASPKPTTKLSESEIRAKRWLEKNYYNGKPITEQDFIAAYRK